MEGIEYDESEWQDWQRELEKSAVHSALGSILLASENLLKARLHLSSAMWEASGWEEGE